MPPQVDPRQHLGDAFGGRLSVVTCGSSPISRSARPGLGPRANFRALPSAAKKARSTSIRRANFIRRRKPSPVISTRSSQGLSMKRRIQASTGAGSGASRMVNIGHCSTSAPCSREQPRKLRFLARLQDENAVAVQSVGHDVTLRDRQFVHRRARPRDWRKGMADDRAGPRITVQHCIPIVDQALHARSSISC